MSSLLESIWKLLISFVTWVFSFFPSLDFSIPTDVMTAINKYLSYALYILPHDTVVIALNIVIVCIFCTFLSAFIRFILDLIRIIKT